MQDMYMHYEFIIMFNFTYNILLDTSTTLLLGNLNRAISYIVIYKPPIHITH